MLTTTSATRLGRGRPRVGSCEVVPVNPASLTSTRWTPRRRQRGRDGSATTCATRPPRSPTSSPTCTGWWSSTASCSARPWPWSSAAGVLGWRWWRRRRHTRLCADARYIDVLAPPEVDPAGGEALWANLVGLLRPAWQRRLFGQPHLGFEYLFSHTGVRIRVWVPGLVPPGLVERAIQAAWPGAHTHTRPTTPIDTPPTRPPRLPRALHRPRSPCESAPVGSPAGRSPVPGRGGTGWWWVGGCGWPAARRSRSAPPSTPTRSARCSGRRSRSSAASGRACRSSPAPPPGPASPAPAAPPATAADTASPASPPAWRRGCWTG